MKSWASNCAGLEGGLVGGGVAGVGTVGVAGVAVAARVALVQEDKSWAQSTPAIKKPCVLAWTLAFHKTQNTYAFNHLNSFNAFVYCIHGENLINL